MAKGKGSEKSMTKKKKKPVASWKKKLGGNFFILMEPNVDIGGIQLYAICAGLEDVEGLAERRIKETGEPIFLFAFSAACTFRSVTDWKNIKGMPVELDAEFDGDDEFGGEW